MSEPTITSLVSTQKTTKKKRIGFRPVAKAKAGRGKPVKALKSSLKASAQAKALPNDNSTTESHVTEHNDATESTKKSTRATRTTRATAAAKKSGKMTQQTTASRKSKRKQSSGVTLGSPGLSRQISETSMSKNNQVDASQESIAASPAEETIEKQSSALTLPHPRAEEQDNNVLERLKAENPEGVRLSSFCTSFKGKKRKRDPKNQTAVAPQKKEKKKEKHNPPPKKSAEANTGAPVVQMINGEIVLEESSLMFPGQRRSVKEVEEEFDVIEEDAQLAIVGASYNSFVNRKGPQHWNVAETKQFYQALRQLGTDFTSMEALFENRTRKQLKRKYTAELSKNPKLVEMALKPDYQKDVDLTVFNVEVDPKRIEAAENEEPPPYEPTNVEPEKPAENNEENTNSQEEEWETVEEDAQAEAHATTNVTLTTTSNHQSLWSSLEEDQDMNAPAEGEVPEPSMEDFFHEQDDPEQEKFESLEKSKAPSSEETKEGEGASLLLVPNKRTSVKSKKRPKIRPAARKRK